MTEQKSTKDAVLDLLESSPETFISGAEIARQLGISRNAVWKAIKILRASGYRVESATNRGYRLAYAPSEFSARSIAELIDDPRIAIEFHRSIGSTNMRAKELAEADAPEGTLVVADEQTAGRGRQGRSFVSPAGTGVYLSLILRPSFALQDIPLITSYAACCLISAIKEVLDKDAQVKWVNDIFLDGRKVSGILSEASFDAETQSIAYVVVGIGVNVLEPIEGFGDATGIAGALTQKSDDPDALRSAIVASIVNRFMAEYELIPQKPHLEAYRSHSLLDGMRVHVVSGAEEFDARVMGIDDDFSLRVELSDGSTRALASGEVHIPSSQLTR